MSCNKEKFNRILKENMTILDQEEIAPGVFSMDLEGDMVAEMRAGQFLHMRVPDPSKLLRRPISISMIDKARKVARVIYRVEGAGTQTFSSLKAGDSLDIMGPQGNGFDLCDIGENDKILLIGGGIGVPPLVEVAKELSQRGAKVLSVLGFATKDAVILEEDLKEYGEVVVTTDDGSYGIKGYVSTVVDDLTDDYKAIYSCGAPGMLKYVDARFEDHPRAYLSMESRMACGMGACYACVVHLRNQADAANKRVCEDGPVFATGSIVL